MNQDVTKEDKEFHVAIAKQYEILTEGFAKSDAAIVAHKFFTPHAWSVGLGDETAIKAEKIEALYSEFVGPYTFTAKSVAPSRIGNAGWDFAEVTLTSKDGSEEIHRYKVLYLWEKEDGAWRCKGQMYVEGSFEGAVADV